MPLYNGVYYNPNEDYASKISTARNSGASQNEINMLEQSRQAKINSSPDKYSSYSNGITAQPYKIGSDTISSKPGEVGQSSIDYSPNYIQQSYDNSGNSTRSAYNSNKSNPISSNVNNLRGNNSGDFFGSVNSSSNGYGSVNNLQHLPNSYNNVLNSILGKYGDMSQQLMNKVNSQYDAAKTDLAGQIPAIQQAADQLRNSNDVAYNTQYKPQMMNALEQSGGYKGGDMAAGMQGLATAHANNQNSVNTNAANQIQGVQNAMSQLEQNKASDIANAQMGIDSNTISQLMQATQMANQNGLDMAQLNAQYGGILPGGNKTLQSRAMDTSNAQNAAAGLGYNDPYAAAAGDITPEIRAQLAPYNNDYAAFINANPGSPLIKYAQELRFQKMLSEPGKYASYLSPYLNFDAQQLQSNNQQQNYNNALNILQTLGYVPNQSIANILGLPVGSSTADYNLSKQRLASSGSGSSTKYDTNKNFNADDYAKYIESVYYQPEQIGADENGNPKYSSRLVVSAQGKRDIASYLANLYQQGVDADIVNSLAAKYNISLQ